MEMIDVTVKPWGNSLAVILPKKLELRANEKIRISVHRQAKPAKVKDIFGLFKDAKLDTKAVLAELRNEEW